MIVSSDKSSISGYINDVKEMPVSSAFTDIELYYESNHSILLRAKRYGQWWILKGISRQEAKYTIHMQRLKKEFDTLIRMQHPGIVRCTEIVALDGKFAGTYIVMEWVDGMTLDRWIARLHSIERKKYVLKQLIDAVGYIHSHSIVHRDLKPENLMVTHNGDYLKVIDFGLSDADNFSILKQPGGTPGYMSPEQQAQPIADVRNDIFSIGIIIDEMHLGRAYNSIISRCLGPIDKRYENIEELGKALNNISRHSLYLYTVPAVLVLIAVTIFIFHYSSSKSIDNVRELPVVDSVNVLQINEINEEPSEKNAKAETSLKFNPPAKSRLAEALSMGINAFEAKAAIIDAKFDTLTVAVKPAEYSEPKRAWKDFYYSSDKFNLSPDELDILYSELENYSTKRYRKWQNRLDSLKNSRNGAN